MRVRLLLIPAFIIMACKAMGQQVAGDSVLNGGTIEVIQKYKPVVRQAPKPEWLPQLPPRDTSRPILNYDVPQQTLYYSYTSESLRPLALGKDTIVYPWPNYIKAGVGNLSTLFLDAGIGALKGDDYTTAIHLHHLSQKGSIAGQQTALSGIQADGTLYKEKYDLHAALTGERDQYYNYGYDHAIQTINNDSIKQTFSTFRLLADLKNKPIEDEKFYYTPAIAASLYSAKNNTNETKIGLNLPVTYTVDETLQLLLALKADLSHVKMDTTSVNNNLAQLLPGVAFKKGQLSGHGILGVAAGKGGTLSMLPDLMVSYTIPRTNLAFSGGWKAGIDMNTYEQLTTENPHLQNTYSVHQTRKDELFADVSGYSGSHFTYNARASWWNYAGLATFLNDTISPNKFYLVYDNVSAIALTGDVRYMLSSKWSAGIYAIWRQFYQGSQAYAWHVPTMSCRGDLTVKPLQQLTLVAYLNILAGINALDSKGRLVTLSPITDLGVSGEYEIVKRLNGFLQISNLLNANNERWLGYKGYGINIYVGLRLKF